ncbi:MAG: hypothetical protein AAGA23_11890 [Pseudomonadota bacterium]
MRNLCLALTAGLAASLVAGAALGHGGVPEPGEPGMPASLTAAPAPNRQPVCVNGGDDEPCGLQQSCLFSEATQPLAAGENVYRRGQAFEVPWLITIVHGQGPLRVTLGHSLSSRADVLVTDYPQGSSGSGDILVVGSLGIPVDFPTGPAVLEIHHDTDNGPYIDCLDLVIESSSLVFGDGFEG